MPPKFLTPTEKVLNELQDERLLQNAKWGGPAHDDEHNVHDWLRYIHERTHECKFTDDPAEQRRILIQIGALAVAAVESHDRKAAK